MRQFLSAADAFGDEITVVIIISRSSSESEYSRGRNVVASYVRRARRLLAHCLPATPAFARPAIRLRRPAVDRGVYSLVAAAAAAEHKASISRTPSSFPRPPHSEVLAWTVQQSTLPKSRAFRPVSEETRKRRRVLKDEGTPWEQESSASVWRKPTAAASACRRRVSNSAALSFVYPECPSPFHAARRSFIKLLVIRRFRSSPTVHHPVSLRVRNRPSLSVHDRYRVSEKYTKSLIKTFLFDFYRLKINGRYVIDVHTIMHTQYRLQTLRQMCT